MITEKDIVYAPSRDGRNAYDLYMPERSDKLLVWFYGGSLKKGSKENRPIAAELAENGIAVAVPDYRLMPEVSYPDFINDAADAVAAIVKKYRATHEIFVGGHSAGAYLSMMLCFDKRYLTARGVYEEIGGYCFISGQPTKHFSVLEAEGIDPRRVIIDDTSALYYVDGTFPRVLIVTSDNDMENRREQNILLASTLKRFGNAPEYVEIPGCTHGGFVRRDGDGEIPSVRYILDFINLKG